MQIVVLGAGYVGLVTAACIADFGHQVTCVEKNLTKLGVLESGGIPIFEPGLAEIVERNRRQERLAFSSDLKTAANGAEAIFIAVGTPQREGDGKADLTYVMQAAEEIASVLTGFTCIVTKSTVPVGTGERVADRIRATNPSADFTVVSNPEFLREGKAIADFLTPDRIIIGLDDDRARPLMERVYAPLVGKVPFLFTTRRNSELIKYAANAFLAMKVGFINEIADLCEVMGASVLDVAKGIGLDHRIGAAYLSAGPGYGGSCFPKDTAALAGMARDVGAPQTLVEATIQSNNNRKRNLAGKILSAGNAQRQTPVVAILGLTFKPDTDDLRESPSLVVIPELIARGANVQVHDPEGMPEASKLLPLAAYYKTPYEAATGADIVVLLTEWRDYRDIDFQKLKAVMRGRTIVDLRNALDSARATQLGFTYRGLGR
jgi:UDPglucose 6-dehydrogenase